MSTPSPFSQPDSLIAGGDVYPKRFITLSTTVFHTALQASDKNQILIGVSEQWTRYPPGSAADDGKHAVSTEPVAYRGPLQFARLTLGATAVTNPRIPLTTDADGKGTPLAPADGTTAYYGALAMEAGAAGEDIRVWVLPPTITV